MTVDIVPIKRLPNQLGIFTYRVPEHLVPRIRRGMYVLIPFRGRNVWGIVLQVPARSIVDPKRLHDIKAIRDDLTLTDDEVTAIERAAEFYRTSMATVALHAVSTPSLREKMLDKISVVKQNSAPLPSRAPPSVASLMETEIHSLLRAKTAICVFNDYRQRSALLAVLSSAVLKQHKSILCCTPHRSWLKPLGNLFATIGPTVIVDRLMGHEVSWTNALAARQTPTIILGTRAAIWHAPPSLGAIIIDQAGSDDLTQWEADPKYDARTVSDWIAHARGIPQILLSPAPRVVDWVRADRRVDLGALTAGAPEVVDLAAYWRSGGSGLISPSARDAITQSIESGRVAVVLHNRRGLAGRIVCRDCDRTLACPSCNIPYAEHASGLRCHRCDRTATVPMTCPICHSPNLKSHGIGTAGIANVLARIFPNVQIARVDRDAPKPPPSDAAIIIGSERFLFSIAPSFDRPVGSIVVVDAARYVRNDDYRANERLFQALRHVVVWGRTWNAPCVIQTSDATLPALTALNRPFTAFYRSELAEREALRYPPATRLIRCVIPEGERLPAIKTLAKVEGIDGPMTTADKRGRPQRIAVIRLDGKASDEDIIAVLQALPPVVRATVDPVTLLD
ncbi:MAG: hypothetical protein V1723_01270 [Candidatus Uhrbacteria bacterium]